MNLTIKLVDIKLKINVPGEHRSKNSTKKKNMVKMMISAMQGWLDSFQSNNKI